jgi:hypothetical protein
LRKTISRLSHGESTNHPLFENVRNPQTIAAEQWEGNAVRARILYRFPVRRDCRDRASLLVDNPEILAAIR